MHWDYLVLACLITLWLLNYEDAEIMKFGFDGNEFLLLKSIIILSFVGSSFTERWMLGVSCTSHCIRICCKLGSVFCFPLLQ